jgi:hypothetical protein
MLPRTAHKYRMPDPRAAIPAQRRSDCLDSAQLDRRERLDALRAATRMRHG